MDIKTARKALRESRTLSLRRSLEASASLGTTSSNFDPEAAVLLERPEDEAAAVAEAHAAAEAAGNGQVPPGQRPSTGQTRDSRSLWRLARHNLGEPLGHRRCSGPMLPWAHITALPATHLRFTCHS
jgi:hypothetical protein